MYFTLTVKFDNNILDAHGVQAYTKISNRNKKIFYRNELFFRATVS